MANTSKRGFASMDASKQREIASKGGRAAHAKGTAHEFTSDEARVAGRKGGEAVSRDRAHMSAIGREGGHSRGARARASLSSGSETLSDTGRPSQTFNRQVNEERGAFENTVGRAASAGGERAGYTTSDRGSRSERTERSDTEGGHGPFSGRENI